MIGKSNGWDAFSLKLIMDQNDVDGVNTSFFIFSSLHAGVKHGDTIIQIQFNTNTNTNPLSFSLSVVFNRNQFAFFFTYPLLIIVQKHDLHLSI
ncbi:hypothetical protein QVD17_07747 [Tagetes erecta]|uniref:Uncharacterized protein n=1 Tax=Tagetes erecta TaxID=13708 RepID=A0AAD8L1V8_TARER|nr:hypothetical protein QVD17_07747 [Tagetes erecta]